MNYTEEHNLVETAREEIPAYDTLAVKQFFHFSTFAKLTGTCLEDMQKLNPSVQRNAIPDNGRQYVIRVPLAAKMSLDSNRISILDSASKVGKKEMELIVRNSAGSTYGRELMVYKVRSGDVLGSIAMRYGVRTDDLKKWNKINGNLIRIGQKINIWVMPTTASAARPATSIKIDENTKTYTVQPGDTLWDITKKKPGLTVEKIKSLNNLKSSKLRPGQKLILG
jgi:FOG: LysM repeat